MNATFYLYICKDCTLEFAIVNQEFDDPYCPNCGVERTEANGSIEIIANTEIAVEEAPN